MGTIPQSSNLSVGTITRLSIALWPNLQVKRCRSAALAAFYPS